ncbi:hypothetical protein COJ21_09790 [Priestia megaterium]|nr:hypothetical protein COJ21_09790 [Priestia megaterium]
MEDKVRDKLRKLIDEYGVRVKFIATKLKWDYPTMIKFKNGQDNYSKRRLEQLNKFLDSYIN